MFHLAHAPSQLLSKALFFAGQARETTVEAALGVVAASLGLLLPRYLPLQEVDLLVQRKHCLLDLLQTHHHLKLHLQRVVTRLHHLPRLLRSCSVQTAATDCRLPKNVSPLP